MKVTILKEPKSEPKEINWGKRLLVKSKNGKFVQTSGYHSGSTFAGTNLLTGEYSEYWDKAAFTIHTEPFTITIENTDI